jgi:hypothetical protein
VDAVGRVSSDDALWVGLVHVTPRAGADLLEGASGGFTNVVALAAGETAFRIRLGIHFASLGFDVVEVDDVELLADRQRTHEVPQAIADLGVDAGESGDVEHDTYYTYD